MVHQEFHALGMGVIVEALDVKIWIRGDEIEYILFPMVGPILPSYVPAFYQNLVETVFGGEINVPFHLGRVGRVTPVWFGFRPVYLVKFDGRELVRVVPRALADDHFPPHATVFYGVNPACILYLAWLVEVQYEVARQHVACVVAHHHRSPRAHAWRLQASFGPVCVWREPTLKRHSLVIKVEVHGGIVHAGSLVNIDIQAVLALHLQRCLHPSGREYCHRRVSPVHSVVEASPDFRQFALLCLLLLRVIVARNPPSRMVSGHRKLRVFFLNDKISQAVLHWKLIAQAHAIVIDPEPNDHHTFGRWLRKIDGQFVIVVANGCGLSPNGPPSFIKRCRFGIHFHKSIH